MNHTQIGNLGEKIATQYLQKMKWQIIEKNWRCVFGEIDIIAIDTLADIFVCVEVKCRHSNTFGNIESSISIHKVQKLYKLCDQYKLFHQNIENMRVDALFIEKKKQKWCIKHYKNIGL